MINKKWVSLIITLTYWIVLLTAATNIFYIILSTQLISWTWERFNMAYYAAEWGREQAIYENNLHGLWFSWNIALTWLLENRIKYKWETSWRKIWSQSWYLTVWDHPEKIKYLDKDLWHYIYSRRFNFYYDAWEVWSGKDIITNNCLSDTTELEIILNVTWANINTDDQKRIVYWKINMKDTDENWTWYILQPEEKCTWPLPIDNNNPFCYTTLPSLTTNNTNEKLIFDENRWTCRNDVWDICKKANPDWHVSPMSIRDFLSSNIKGKSWPNYNPTLSISYSFPLFDTNQPIINYPIKYTITWASIQDCIFPTLTKKIKWIWQVYWAIIEVTANISQEEWLTVFDYAIIQ